MKVSMARDRDGMVFDPGPLGRAIVLFLPCPAGTLLKLSTGYLYVLIHLRNTTPSYLHVYMPTSH